MLYVIFINKFWISNCHQRLIEVEKRNRFFNFFFLQFNRCGLSAPFVQLELLECLRLLSMIEAKGNDIGGIVCNTHTQLFLLNFFCKFHFFQKNVDLNALYLRVLDSISSLSSLLSLGLLVRV